ncbi:MAG: ATP-binding protein [Bacteroidia bacterium]|nr:ATP-binding protein [Bacteroidia bacterium]
MHKEESMLRVALIGPESSGKTSLCKLLSAHYNTAFVPEYSRSYVEKLNRNYTEEDVLHCIQEQFNTEKSIIQNKYKIIFVDTDAIMGKVWLEDVFKKCPQWVEEIIQQFPYDLYLLTFPDLEFEADPVRENPHRLGFFFDWYESELIKRKLNYRVVKGSSTARFENALQFVEELFHLPKT